MNYGAYLGWENKKEERGFTAQKIPKVYQKYTYNNLETLNSGEELLDKDLGCFN